VLIAFPKQDALVIVENQLLFWEVIVMPRPDVQGRGRVGKRLKKALRECGLTVQEAAAAARLDKGTVYRLVTGQTKRPHYSTMRSLCKVLNVDIAEIWGAEQLQFALFGLEMESRGLITDLEQLLVDEIRSFPEKEIEDAISIAILAVLEVRLGRGRGVGVTVYRGLRHLRRVSESIEDAVTLELRQVPQEMQQAAVRAALGALIDLRLLAGKHPTRAAYSRIFYLRNRLWVSMEKPKVGVALRGRG
jgi:transcriptional regulator with XRE-family HTH domain